MESNWIKKLTDGIPILVLALGAVWVMFEALFKQEVTNIVDERINIIVPSAETVNSLDKRITSIEMEIEHNGENDNRVYNRIGRVEDKVDNLILILGGGDSG